MASNRSRIDTLDYSKMPFKKAQQDYRTGNDDIGAMLNFEPYESGYCFLATMATPKIMWANTNSATGDPDKFAKADNRHELLKTFVDIIEKEFRGLSGIEDQTLSTNDISNNIVNIPVVAKNDRNYYNTVTMNFTEKSGLPILKFLEKYSNYVYDPYSNVKSYGGRRKTSNTENMANGYKSFHRKRNNETFSFLYVITDRTALLVEKAYILYQAYPLGVPFSTIADNNKFEVETKEISLNFVCEVLDGPLANRLGSIYVRSLYDYVLKKQLLRGQTWNGIDEKDYHIAVPSPGDGSDTPDLLGTMDFTANYNASERYYKNMEAYKDETDSRYVKRYIEVVKDRKDSGRNFTDDPR